MKTIKFFVLIAALFCFTAKSHAQRVENVKDVAKEEGVDRTNNNISSGVDNAMSKTEGAIKGLFKKKKPNNNTATNSSNSQGTPQSSGGSGLRAYNNYDFVPGDSVVFADDFSHDVQGEFASHWALGAGQGVVNQVAGNNALLLTDGNYARVSPLIKTKKIGYLDDPFTIEFDSYSTGGYLPHMYFYPSAAAATASSGNILQVDIGAANSHGAAEISNGSNVDLQGNYPPDISSDNYMKKWHHIAIAYKNSQVKVYVDQYRVVVAPNVGYIKPKAFDIEGIGDGNNPIIIANVRVANGGGMNMLGKKFTEAKIVTHGINFDIDQSTIKPESMGTLNMIKNVLNDNPDLKFEIDGHTDNSGISAHNMVLSQQRADAVKAQLINMGIDGSRLATKGFGDSKPIGNNSTDDGRANNRRVEFVRM